MRVFTLLAIGLWLGSAAALAQPKSAGAPDPKVVEDLVAASRMAAQVVFRAYYAEMNASLQSEAIKLGAVTYLTPEEAAAAAKTNDALVMRPWELWKRKAMKPE